MTTQDYLSLGLKDIIRLSEKELRKAVSTLRSTARKRYNRLFESGTVDYSPAALKLLKGGLIPAIKGMDIKTLRNEFKRYREFLGMKTSTVSGVKKYRTNIRENLRTLTGNVNAFTTEDETDRFLSLYNKFMDTLEGSYVDYKVVMSIVEEIYNDNQDLSDDEILNRAAERLKEVYEKEHFTSDFFEEYGDYDT